MKKNEHKKGSQLKLSSNEMKGLKKYKEGYVEDVKEMRCSVEDVMRRKATSGFVWTTERVATAATPLQTELLAECEGASLRQVVMIHPALVLEKKVVSGKQFNPTVRKCEGMKGRRCSACGSDIP